MPNITTVFQPTVTITVSDSELQGLLKQGLVYSIEGGPPIVRPVLPADLSAELDRRIGVAFGNLATGDAGYDLVLLLGQSNMAGRGTPYDTVHLDPSDLRIEQYGSTGAYAGFQSVAVEPLAMHDTPTGIGPGLAFARWYVQSIPSMRRVLLVPAAHGGTRLSTTMTPLGWRRGVAGNLYEQALAQARAALASAGPNSRIVAGLWVQGESDGDSNNTAAQYQTDLDALIAGLRSDLGIPDLPFVVGQMVPEYLNTGTRVQINSVHASVQSRVSRTAFSQGVIGQSMNDGNHYNAVAQRAIGRRLFDALRRILTNTSDGALPAVPGQITGLVASTSGSTATLTWDVSVTSIGYAVDYRVAGSTTWIRATTVTSPTYVLGGLSSANSYEVRVSGVNNGGVGVASATLILNPGGVTNVVDSFNRADSTTSLGTADSGQVWSPNASTWGVVSNQASMLSGSNGRVTIESGRADGTVQVTFATLSTGSNHGRLLFRSDGSVNYWMVQLRVTGGAPGKYQLYKSVNGTLTQVGSDSAVTGVAGDVVKVVVTGDSITVSVNGASAIVVSDSFNNTTTQHGLAAVGTGPTFDNFSVTG